MDRIQQGADFAETVLQHILILLTDSLKEAVSDTGAYKMRDPTDTWGSLDFSHHGNQSKGAIRLLVLALGWECLCSVALKHKRCSMHKRSFHCASELSEACSRRH